MPVDEQELVIGRRKIDSEELEDKPDDSHVASTDQDRFGDIFRRNTPYGTIADHGTMFVGFCSTREPLADDAREHGGPDQWHTRCVDAVHDAVERRLLLRPVGRGAHARRRLTRLTRSESVKYAPGPSLGEELLISETTVKTHVTHILSKLELRDRVQAVVLEYQTGLDLGRRVAVNQSRRSVTA